MNPARESMAVEQFGPYEVYERLGMGGMASVHRAKKRGPAGFERTVALKRMLSHLTEDRGFVESFVREAKVASLLAHPNIAQTYDFGRINGIFYIAMELVSGHDVRKLLRHAHKTNEPIPMPVVMSLLGELCDALDYAHSFVDENGQPMGIVHRDISPSNMIVAGTGHLKVIDFGIAKANSRQLHTETGTVKGKLGYMAPETALGMAVGPVSDIFSMGVVAWELVTASPLFSARTDFETMRKLREEQVTPPSRYNPQCPPMLDQLILAALEREPEHRIQSARAFRATLDGICQQFGIVTSARGVADWIRNTIPEPEPRGSLMSNPGLVPGMPGFVPAGTSSSGRVLPLPAGPETAISRPSGRASMRPSLLNRSHEEVALATEIWGEDNNTSHTSNSGPDFSMASGSFGMQSAPEPLPYTPAHLSVPSLSPQARLSMQQPVANPPTGIRPKRSKAPLAVLAGLAIVAGILGGILYAKRQPKAAAAQGATVHFVITPEGATVEVGGNSLGSGSPLDAELAPGVYSVAVKHDGYKPWMTSLTLAEGEKQTINVALEKATVVAEANPDGSAAGSAVPVLGSAAEPDTGSDTTAPQPDEHDDTNEPDHSRPSGKRPHNKTHHSSGSTTSSGNKDPDDDGSDAAKPDPIKPDATKPDPIKLDPVKPDPIKPDPIKPDPIKPDPVKPEPVKPKTTPVVGPNVVTKISGDIPSLRSSEGGDVTAKMCIDEQGKVTSVKILKGPADIASDLQRALMTWRFKPYVNRESKISPVCFPQSIRVIKK